MTVESTLLHGVKVNLTTARDSVAQLPYWEWEVQMLDNMLDAVDERLEELKVGGNE